MIAVSLFRDLIVSTEYEGVEHRSKGECSGEENGDAAE